MFDFLTDSIENVLDVTEGLLDGEMPSKRQVARMVGDGLTIATIASAAGVAEEVIKDLIN